MNPGCLLPGILFRSCIHLLHAGPWHALLLQQNCVRVNLIHSEKDHLKRSTRPYIWLNCQQNISCPLTSRNIKTFTVTRSWEGIRSVLRKPARGAALWSIKQKEHTSPACTVLTCQIFCGSSATPSCLYSKLEPVCTILVLLNLCWPRSKQIRKHAKVDIGNEILRFIAVSG